MVLSEIQTSVSDSKSQALSFTIFGHEWLIPFSVKLFPEIGYADIRNGKVRAMMTQSTEHSGFPSVECQLKAWTWSQVAWVPIPILWPAISVATQTVHCLSLSVLVCKMSRSSGYLTDFL